ncbi:MAG: tyrosine-type recombinase/integrase [Bacteroidota bacterium]
MSSTYDRITLAFKEWLGLIGYSPSTVQHMPRRVQEFFTFLETAEIKTLQEIEPQHIQAFYQLQKDRASHNSGKPLSNSTVNGYLRNLRLLAQYLQETGQGFIEVDIPNEPKATPEKEILSPVEIMQLYNAADENVTGLRDRALLSVYYGCGLRSNEGIQLNVSDILLEKGLLYVQKGKGNKERYVPFVQSQYQDFKNYLDYCRPLLVKGDKTQEAFILNGQGRRITYQNALTTLKTLQQRTGNEQVQNRQIGLHTLRHSIATHLLQRKMPLEDISRFLGHKSIYSTEVYTHILTNHERPGL